MFDKADLVNVTNLDSESNLAKKITEHTNGSKIAIKSHRYFIRLFVVIPIISFICYTVLLSAGSPHPWPALAALLVAAFIAAHDGLSMEYSTSDDKKQIEQERIIGMLMERMQTWQEFINADGLDTKLRGPLSTREGWGAKRTYSSRLAKVIDSWEKAFKISTELHPDDYVALELLMLKELPEDRVVEIRTLTGNLIQYDRRMATEALTQVVDLEKDRAKLRQPKQKVRLPE